MPPDTVARNPRPPTDAKTRCSHHDPRVCDDYREEARLDRVVRYFNAVLLRLEAERAAPRRSLAARWAASRPLLRRALRYLLRRRRRHILSQDVVFWERIHAHLTSYYPHLSEHHRLGRARIPVVSVVMHNRAVGWWLRRLRGGGGGEPVLHADSHIDMNPQHLAGGRLAAAARRVAARRAPPAALDRAVWDIGAVVTAFLALDRAPRDVVWLYPAWIAAPPRTAVPVDLVEEDGYACYQADHPRRLREAMRPAGRRPGARLLRRFRYTQSRGRTARQWDRVGAALGRRFVLDIDLDYFVTNGTPRQTRAGEFESEAPSPRRRPRCNITASPRHRFAATAQLERRRRATEAELRAIDRRLRDFLRGLRRLRRRGGARPVLVSLSDSAAVLGGLQDGISWNNDYTPAHLVLYVRLQLMAGLRKIYGSDAFSLH